ncbi:hypothetical protein Prudu_1169S005700 [Prunus dulcis]|uniref:Uncharacterized protein n=1 Tax=Prunus dulcis TaxID=3755 RepID=A0A5H2XPB0_PRUDU|nr:hypothetical protein Prudu_1169S005700 [Prunus dulcis]
MGSNGHGTGGVGTAIESPTFSNRPQPWGRPELAGKSCFPTEVRSKLPKLPARSSPSFLHQIDREFGVLVPRFFGHPKSLWTPDLSARVAARGQGGGTALASFEFTNLIFRDNQAPGARQNYKRDLRGIEVEFWDWSKYRGDSAEFSAEV